MKRLALALVVMTLLANSGCQSGHALAKKSRGGSPWGGCGDGTCGAGNGAGGCRDGLCGAGGIHGMAARHADVHVDTAPTTGPATGAVAYPYYTTRGPRDFLNPNPPSIGY